ncbi:hypothetical protein HDF26_004447 [Pedobacter cryoconitis]|uniref:DUF4198 domain-containing protein n=1 Tax=Pedobacter cryoconitis TaxID=188932 RepID=A0A7W8ZNC0_9SPHI|nr:hypothetical protein [Pedobacter cryoconitis]MBB5637214.1 hypothetical protein [Pedobacter cryoconitis]MBB6273974.1 hypothetical protein [Pedobacter cryoconitis]
MKRNIYLLLLLVSLPFISQAHGYWFDIKGSGKANQPVQIQICFGEIDEYNIRHRETGPELIQLGDFKITVIDAHGKKTSIQIHPKADCWEGTFIPKEKGVYQILGINETLPVVDRSKTGGKNVRPIDYLCAAYQVEQSGYISGPVQFLDIVTSKREKLVVVKAFNNGHPASSTTKLRVFNPENWEKSLEIDEHGEAVFMPAMKGLYIIREDFTVPVTGTYQGLPYTSIRHRCNYSLLVN